MKTHAKGRLAGLLAALCLAFSLVPMTAWADDVISLTKGSIDGSGKLQLEGGKSYRMDEDMTVAAPILIEGSVTFDLNGHTLSHEGNDGTSVFALLSEGGVAASLTLKDGSESGSGKVTSARYAISLGGGGHFTLESGTVEGTGDCFVISGSSGDKVTLHGGLVDGSRAKGAIGGYGVCVEADGGKVRGVVENKRGSIICTEGASGTVFYGALTNGTADPGSSGANGNISGGVYYGPVTSYHWVGLSMTVERSSVISGGIFYKGIEEPQEKDLGSAIKGNTITFKNGEDQLAVEVLSGGAKSYAPMFDSSDPDAPAAPSKTGFTFASKWYADKACTEEFTFGDSISKDIVLYAGFEPKLYTVDFDSAGDSAPVSKTNVRWADRVLDGVADPTRAGWVFDCWTCNGATVTPDTTYGELAASDEVARLTLAAQWKAPIIVDEDAKPLPEASGVDGSDDADGSESSVIAKTGDGSHLAFWLSLLLASAVAVTICAARKMNERV